MGDGWLCCLGSCFVLVCWCHDLCTCCWCRYWLELNKCFGFVTMDGGVSWVAVRQHCNHSISF